MTTSLKKTTKKTKNSSECVNKKLKNKTEHEKKPKKTSKIKNSVHKPEKSAPIPALFSFSAH
jgi:hypothetical protein